MVDDYAGYKALFGDQITELACLAHVRRKFFNLHAANSSPQRKLQRCSISVSSISSKKKDKISPTLSVTYSDSVKPSHCFSNFMIGWSIPA